MPSLNEIITTGGQIINVSTPLIEALDASPNFGMHLARFGDNYDITNTSHLYRFLVTLCGEAGAGSIKKEMLYSRLQSLLESTYFLDLDRLYGEALALPRLSREVYNLDPYNQMLNQAQWQEVKAKDSSYRERCLLWMRAIIEGPTIKGMQLAAEAAIGVDCHVVERYQYLDNLSSDLPLVLPDTGFTLARQEFTIVPNAPSVTEAERRRCSKLIDRLRPVNTIPTINTGIVLRKRKNVARVAATSERFNIQRLVTGQDTIDWPIDPAQRFWITTEEQEAPTYAFMDRQESVTYLDIVDSSASSTHYGNFNAQQRQLYAHLGDAPATDYEYKSFYSYIKTLAPLNLSTPFVTSTTSDIIVNNHYPIGYFAELNLVNFAPQSTSEFWASNEKTPGTSETLTLDLGRDRPVNFIDLEISQKPVDITIEYQTTPGVWVEITPRADIEPEFSVAYQTSTENPWHRFELYFELVETDAIRLTIDRRSDPFPFPESAAFPWSVEIRNLRLLHVIAAVDDFTDDTGIDILGNVFRTDIDFLPATNVLEDEETEVPVTNLLPNGGFETGFTGWTSWNAANLFNSTSIFKMGTKSLQVTTNGVAAGEGVRAVSAFTVTSGSAYTVSFYIKGVAGTSLTYGWSDAGGSGANTHILTGQWEFLTLTKTATATGNATVFVATNFTTAGTFYIDAAMVETGSIAHEYVETNGTISTQVRYPVSTFWQSQPNTTRHAVEALYFDLRPSGVAGTMSYLDQFVMDELDTRSMYDMEHNQFDGVVIDEVFVDPLTTGPDMNIYYSLDTEGDWDNKLWIPIARRYKLKRGFHSLPSPTFVKFIKLEFTNLAAAPYQPIEYPTMPTATYRKFPTWVQSYFEGISPSRPYDPRDVIANTVTINPLAFGFVRVIDAYQTTYEEIRDVLVSQTGADVETLIKQILKSKTTSTISDAVVDIDFQSPLMWQADLVAQLDTTRALSRAAQTIREGIFDTGFTAELGLPIYTPPIAQSVSDVSHIYDDKVKPHMFFPQKCRHGYQMVTSSFDRKLAYFVAIKSVQFWRRDYTVDNDDNVFIETLDDTAHIEQNDFVRQDYIYVAG